jgi:hypothetical protein
MLDSFLNDNFNKVILVNKNSYYLNEPEDYISSLEIHTKHGDI